ARVYLKMSEGTQFWFGPVTLSGEAGYSREQILAEVADELSQPFTEGRLAAAQRKLVDFYKRRGHFAATVAAASHKAAAVRGRVPVAFELAPGPIHSFDGI